MMASIEKAVMLLYFATVFVLDGNLWLLLLSAALSALIPNIPQVEALTPLQHQTRLGFCTWLSCGLPTVGLQRTVAQLRCWHSGR